ncbi:DUF1826 domain-containing protein [Sphingomonas sp. Leaf17]|uniref:DUF1826 domain-containing protein n=1 Tax=Sphingomonas sp. Leaf17 TaxID=1735683 RepID=UPI00138F6E69|nr:DUF1826 domain-containing protein [Sphingomonas sp. Leaf17]
MPTLALPEHVRIGEGRAILSAVRRADVNLAVWSRGAGRVPVGSLALSAVDDVALASPVAVLADAVERALTDAGYAGAVMSMLATDITMLGDLLAQMLDCDRLAIRLEVVDTDACRRFQADYVTARLICTYAGPATQWLANVDAAALLGGAVTDDLPIRQLATGDVAIFKGREWSPDQAIVHRSPPVAGTGRQRLVLVIDTAPGTPIPHA